ncbi:MAG TPA: TadE/TadG family type IV pilus assembly protein [Micromonosporaceae bacterium]|jgi:Flp pilus assembly protein TadG|nr:TadE/TadG family type IV pilus assembly protein [Micromonosporaceae bacterium]
MTGPLRVPMHAPAARRRRVDRGASTLEAAILTPALLLIIGLAIVAMRISVADQAVEAAAHDAARAASIARTQTEAQQAARDAALNALSQQGLNCNPTVQPDTSQFSRPIGETAVVTVTVICDVKLSDIGMPGLPGDHVITATFTSYLDQFRGRS